MDVLLEGRRFLASLGAMSWHGNLSGSFESSTAVLDGYLLKAICHVALRPRRFQMAVLEQILTAAIGCKTNSLTRSWSFHLSIV